MVDRHPQLRVGGGPNAVPDSGSAPAGQDSDATDRVSQGAGHLLGVQGLREEHPTQGPEAASQQRGTNGAPLLREVQRVGDLRGALCRLIGWPYRHQVFC